MKFNINLYVFPVAGLFYMVWPALGEGLFWLYISVILHEAGHAVAALLVGWQILEFNTDIHRGNVQYGGNATQEWVWYGHLFVTAAGPAMNFALLFAGTFFHCDILVLLNIYILVFNLYPAGKSDGYFICYNIWAILTKQTYVTGCHL